MFHAQLPTRVFAAELLISADAACGGKSMPTLAITAVVVLLGYRAMLAVLSRR
jgi:hypothetical protein